MKKFIEKIVARELSTREITGDYDYSTEITSNENKIIIITKVDVNGTNATLSMQITKRYLETTVYEVGDKFTGSISV